MKLTLARILVPVDFSPPSDAALSLAARYGESFGAEVDLVHVMHTTRSLLGGGSFVWSDDEAKQVREGAAGELRARAEGLRKAGVACVETLLVGEPHVEIVRHAERGHDLIIMGTQGITGLAHALIGSVAERVVQRSPCPVLVVPPARAATG